MPAADLTDRVELTGIPGAPQRNWALIEYPAHREREHRFAEPLLRQLFELVNRGQILAETLALEFRINLAQVVAVKSGFQTHAPAQKAAAERAVAQDSETGAFRVGQHVRVDFALKEIVRGLNGIEPCH